MKGKTDVVCFITGELKKNLGVAFNEFLKKSKDKREPGASSASGAAMSDTEPEKWKVVFFNKLVEWLAEQVDTAGAKPELKTTVEGALSKVQTPGFGFKAVDTVKMKPKDPPSDRPWVAEVSFTGAVEGSEAYGAFTESFRKLYRSKGEGKSKPAELSIRADFGKKDRPLTALCAEVGGLEVRTGKGGPAGSARPADSKRTERGAKRESPSTERGGNTSKQRTDRR